MRAPIVSRKHIVQHTQFTVASTAVASFIDIQGVAVQNVNTAQEVIEGSVVKAIYIEIWLITSEATPPGATFVMIVEKANASTSLPGFTNMTTLDAYPNKKNILYTTQGLVALNAGNPSPLLRQWIKIPKGKQRFGLDDRLRINIAAIGANDLVGCGLSIFKSYQ